MCVCLSVRANFFIRPKNFFFLLIIDSEFCPESKKVCPDPGKNHLRGLRDPPTPTKENFPL